MTKVEYDIHIAKEKVRMKKGYLTKSERTKLQHMIDNPNEYISEEKPKNLQIKPIITNIIELKKPCIPIEKNEDISQIVQELKDTLSTLKGYALSANQIGYNKRVCYLRIPQYNKESKKIEIQEIVAINPKIIEQSMKIKCHKEGCLSFPGVRVDTARYVFCIVQYEDEKRETHTDIVQDLASFIWQHEIDHLRGFIIFDRKYKRK